MAISSLSRAFLDELQDVYSAEKQLTHALPKMVEGAANDQLRAGFEHHLEQTRQHVDRIEQVFASIDRSPESKGCEGMKGIVHEGQEVLEEQGPPDVKDAALIAAAQKVEHYEIASYGTLCTWAELLGYTQALELLKQTLAEEKETDEKLSKIAEQAINPGALKAA